jgi:hypothetical protein
MNYVFLFAPIVTIVLVYLMQNKARDDGYNKAENEVLKDALENLSSRPITDSDFVGSLRKAADRKRNFTRFS